MMRISDMHAARQLRDRWGKHSKWNSRCDEMIHHVSKISQKRMNNRLEFLCCIHQRSTFISVIYQRSTSISVQRDPPDSTGTLDVHHLPDALPECKYALHKWLA